MKRPPAEAFPPEHDCALCRRISDLIVERLSRLDPVAYEGRGRPYCVLCRSRGSVGTAGHHKAECPWRMARELLGHG